MMCRKAAQIDAAQGEGGQSLCAVSSWSLSWATPFLPELGGSVGGHSTHFEQSDTKGRSEPRDLGIVRPLAGDSDSTH